MKATHIYIPRTENLATPTTANDIEFHPPVKFIEAGASPDIATAASNCRAAMNAKP
jgi:hypothetical protein